MKRTNFAKAKTTVLSFQEALEKYTNPEQAIEEITKLLVNRVPEGTLNAGSTSFNLSVERTWTVSADISVRVDYDHDFRREVTDTEVPYVVAPAHLVIRVNWSTIQRGVVEAMAAVALYQELVQAAALAEATANRMKIASVRRSSSPEE